MSFSEEWDQAYRQGMQAISWPWSDVVSFTMRYARPTGPEFRVLELGCGSGANIPFYKKTGCQYFAVEGSAVIIEQVVKAHPDLKGRIAHADFTVDLPFVGAFDLVIDRGSLTCNSTAAIRRGLSKVREKLKPGGKYIGIDWFSTLHSDYQKGRADEDPFTRTGFEDGLFAGLGRIHFADKAHLLDLFREFEVTALEHKLLERAVPPDGRKVATWNLATRKAI